MKSSNIFDQILSVDNFVAFKKLMVKKNKELYLEAYNLLEQEGRINPKIEEKITVDINKKPEVNKISEGVKKEVDYNFELQKTNKIVSIYEKKLNTAKDEELTDEVLKQIKKDLGPLKELQPLTKPVGKSLNQIDEIRNLIKSKKTNEITEQDKIKKDEEDRAKEIKNREEHFLSLKNKINEKRNTDIKNEYESHMKDNGNKLESIPAAFKNWLIIYKLVYIFKMKW